MCNRGNAASSRGLLAIIVRAAFPFIHTQCRNYENSQPCQCVSIYVSGRPTLPFFVLQKLEIIRHRGYVKGRRIL